MIIDIAKDGTEIKEITEINEKLEKAFKDCGLIMIDQDVKLVNVRGKYYIENLTLKVMPIKQQNEPNVRALTNHEQNQFYAVPVRTLGQSSVKNSIDVYSQSNDMQS